MTDLKTEVTTEAAKVETAIDTHVAVAETIAKLDIAKTEVEIAQTEATWKTWLRLHRVTLIYVGVGVVLVLVTVLR